MSYVWVCLFFRMNYCERGRELTKGELVFGVKGFGFFVC